MRDDLLGTLTKQELLDIMTGALCAHVASFEYAPRTTENEAFSQGYRAALEAVAHSAGLVNRSTKLPMIGEGSK